MVEGDLFLWYLWEGGGGGEICVLGFVGGKSKSILEYKIILSGMFTSRPDDEWDDDDHLVLCR